MAGLCPDLYQQMLTELTGQAQLGDDLGYDSISFTDRHVHVGELRTFERPVLLGVYIAMPTKKTRLGHLGIVLLAQTQSASPSP